MASSWTVHPVDLLGRHKGAKRGEIAHAAADSKHLMTLFRKDKVSFIDGVRVLYDTFASAQDIMRSFLSP